jgi:hypothetical protein
MNQLTVLRGICANFCEAHSCLVLLVGILFQCVKILMRYLGFLAYCVVVLRGIAPEDGQLTGRNICRADFLKL